MVSVLVTKCINTQWEETLGGDGFVYSIGCCDGFMGVYTLSALNYIP